MKGAKKLSVLGIVVLIGLFVIQGLSYVEAHQEKDPGDQDPNNTLSSNYAVNQAFDTLASGQTMAVPVFKTADLLEDPSRVRIYPASAFIDKNTIEFVLGTIRTLSGDSIVIVVAEEGAELTQANTLFKDRTGQNLRDAFHVKMPDGVSGENITGVPDVRNQIRGLAESYDGMNPIYLTEVLQFDGYRPIVTAITDGIVAREALVSGEMLAVLSEENTATDDAVFSMRRRGMPEGSYITLDVHASITNPKALLRNMHNLGLLVPFYSQSGNSYFFSFASPSERQVKTVLFTEDFAVNQRAAFLDEVDNLGEDQIAVVIASDETWQDTASLPGIQERAEAGRIRIMSVGRTSPAYAAFERLFAGENFVDLGQRVRNLEELLNDRELVRAIETAK